MADLNALIAQGAQFQPLPDPFAQYGRMQQLQQGQQANQLNQMKMDEYQRGLQEQNALRSSVSSDFDINNPAHVNAVLRASPTAGAAFLEKFSQGAKERGLAEKAKNEAIKFNLDNSRSLLVGINDQPSYDAWRAYSVKNLPELANILPVQFSAEAKDSLLKTADDISKRLTAAPNYQSAAPGATVLKDGVPVYTAPPAVEKPKVTDLMANYQAALGQGFTGSIFDYERKLKEAGRPPAAPRPEQPPVAVVDPVTGKQVYVTREEALRGRMAPATALEGLAPKEIQSREAKYPQATSAVKTFESKADSLAADMEKLANHPGLSGISGIIYGRTPAVTKEARAAQALYDSIVARGGFAELQAMRASSPTGGALGNVSNQEGQYLRDAFAPINRTQDTGDLKAALTNAANATRSSKQRVRDAYDMTYDYKTGGSAAPKPSAVAPNVDALLEKYK